MGTLWVGNISPETTDMELTALFAGHGALDCVTMHGARSFAFVFFPSAIDARAAKESLRNTKIRGKFINIEFSRPARPCKRLWIVGIALSVTEEQLKAKFAEFGSIKQFNFYRDRNSALIDYVHVGDAITAQQNLNGKHISDNQIRVAFLMAKPSRMEFCNRNSSQNECISSSGIRRNTSKYQQRTMMLMHQEHQSHRLQRDDQPSNVLWVGYPPNLPIDEQKLFNTMILCGEIETIKRIPWSHGCYVEFRSIDEACRTKERFEGCLFGEPSIQILFANNATTPNIGRTPAHPVPSMSKRPLDGQGSGLHYRGVGFPSYGGTADDTLVDHTSFPNKFIDTNYRSSMPQIGTRDSKKQRNDVFPPTDQTGFQTRRMGFEDFRDLHVTAQNNGLEDGQNLTQGSQQYQVGSSLDFHENNYMVQNTYDHWKPQDSEEPSDQRPRLQIDSLSSCQGISESDAEKCHRYECILQFAADILLQIYQRQQQLATSQNGQGNQ